MSHDSRGDAKDGESGTLLFILLILLLVGGVGAGGYWVLGQRRQAAVQADMQAMEAERAAQEAAAAEESLRKAKVP